MMRRWMRRNGHGLIVMNMSISIRKRIWWKILAFILAAALAAAIGIYGWKKGIFLPDWIVWQEKRQTVEEKGGEIFLEQRSLTLKGRKAGLEIAEGDSRAGFFVVRYQS